MWRQAGLILLLLLISLSSCNQGKPDKLVILETTDVHGMIFPFDFIEREASRGSLASVHAYIRAQRFHPGELLLLDNGDNLQGQPTEYYFNFIDTATTHLNARVMNFMNYDAGTVGNHDIEAGHQVYDRLEKDYAFPLLAANAVDIKTGKPWFEPYTIVRKGKLKIAILGLITPSVPDWLPPVLYEGMEFADMEETARKWMPVIKRERPDLVVGLFHSGWQKASDTRLPDAYRDEEGSNAVAYNVPGFDIIFTGHDHSEANERFINSAGDTILILNGGSRAETLARADVIISGKKHSGKRSVKSIGSLVKMNKVEPDSGFMQTFAQDNRLILDYVETRIGECGSEVSSRDSFFGSSAFTDMIHRMQLEISGADLSFAAPLSFDVGISEGPLTVSDMFRLYRFENMLYTVSMSGAEIVKYLEYSYSGWINTMNKKSDHLLNFRTDTNGAALITNGRARLRFPSYNFDSAAGIDYTVDVTKKTGERVTVISLTGGRPFSLKDQYRVAVNSYRGSGGGGHFPDGAGIDDSELKSRLLSSTVRDLRYYMIKEIEKEGKINPVPLENWSFVPAEWIQAATKRDYRLLFGGEMK